MEIVGTGAWNASDFKGSDTSSPVEGLGAAIDRAVRGTETKAQTEIVGICEVVVSDPAEDINSNLCAGANLSNVNAVTGGSA